ncbi:hypothetical protein AFE02nite_27010 [Actinotalea fermentans]|uniref:Uncharacterized protein n=1 Tax=Actinotalea fermentans TaxID=43671 RepID=A0A511Z0H6_9CELL|nr:hypothetical protein AFE02nite_27010 [Actinotalea fermentans]
MSPAPLHAQRGGEGTFRTLSVGFPNRKHTQAFATPSRVQKWERDLSRPSHTSGGPSPARTRVRRENEASNPSSSEQTLGLGSGCAVGRARQKPWARWNQT